MNAVRVALKGDRSCLKVRQQERGDSRVVADKVDLPEPGGGVKDLFRIRNGNAALSDPQIAGGGCVGRLTRSRTNSGYVRGRSADAKTSMK